jgi:hypothetical protein
MVADIHHERGEKGGLRDRDSAVGQEWLITVTSMAAIWQQAEYITLSEQSNVLCVLFDLPTTSVPSSTQYVYLTRYLTHLLANNGSL